MKPFAFSRGLAAASFWAALVAGAPASAQPAPQIFAVPAFEPGIVLPLQEPAPLAVGNVPAFRFAAEFLNLGVPLPQTPGRMLIEGGGAAVRGARMTGWEIAIDRVTLDGQVLAATMPLVTISTDIGDEPSAPHIYRAEYPGLDTLPQAPPQSPIRNIIRRVVDTLAWSLASLPRQAVTTGSPAIDIADTLRRHLGRSLPDSQLVQPPAPGVAEGIIERLGRRAVLVRQESPLVVRTAYRDVQMRTQGVAAIDATTGLPLFLQARVFGPVDLPVARGPVDFTMRIAVALEGMGDPAATLAPPQMPSPVALAPAPSPEAPPPEAAPAPAKPRPAAKPPAPAQPKPAEPAVAAPMAPAPEAKPPAPAGATGGEIARRLEQLKSIFDRGLITKEQYEAKREAILKEL